MRLAYYAGASTAAAAACLLKAFHERPNFYSATVYLSQSNACLLIITNLILLVSCSFMYGVQRVLYGPLRPIEVEQLSEKAWYAVLDTLLAMPSFREDVGGWLLAMFTLLLAGKVWGWIGEGKVDVLEQQPPANPKLFHARLATSLVVSVFFDLWMLDYCVETVLADPRPGMMVIFAFEFAVLSICSAFTLARYLLCVCQIRIELAQTKKAMDERKSEILAERAEERLRLTAEGVAVPDSLADDPIEVDENEIDIPGWEEKRRYLFALEVFTDFVKLLIYIVFFTVSITFNGLPMHIMRDVYMTFASFSKRISNYVAYRKATSDMNTRYPDATMEEIRGDACIVCRESMVAWEAAAAPPNAEQPAQARPATEQPPQAAPPQARARKKDEGLRAKKLPCGHILHLRCLKAWLERQQVCPTCRSPVVAARSGVTAPRAQGGAGGGVADANAPAAGQQQQPPAGNQPAQRRPGRARVLNLGPVRIGFLNGPGDQIANLLRQMNNQQAAPAAPQAQDANQQGPNHLGLQDPYLPGSERSASNSGASTQTQLQQIEQRLMHEAQTLNIQSQQLSTLMVMEQEMARLRALQNPAQQSSNAVPQMPAMRIPVQLPNIPMPGHMPMAPMMPFQPNNPPLAFRGIPTQQYSNGHESLPAGMTLPEGWTVMPLQRASPPGTHIGVPSMGSQPESTAVNDVPGSTGPPVGPTDENGSPLFVPTAPETTVAPAPSVADSSTTATEGNVATSTAINSENEAPPAAPSSSEAAQASQSDRDSKVPWTTEGWSFVEPPNGHAPEGAGPQASAPATQSANGAPPESGEEASQDKGKGKAVAVEEVPDSGA